MAELIFTAKDLDRANALVREMDPAELPDFKSLRAREMMPQRDWMTLMLELRSEMTRYAKAAIITTALDLEKDHVEVMLDLLEASAGLLGGIDQTADPSVKRIYDSLPFDVVHEYEEAYGRALWLAANRILGIEESV